MYSHDSGQDADWSYSREKSSNRNGDVQDDPHIGRKHKDNRYNRKGDRKRVSDGPYEEKIFNVAAVSSSDESDEEANDYD